MNNSDRERIAGNFVKMLSEEVLIATIEKARWGGTKTDGESANILARDAGGDASAWTNSSFKLIPEDMQKGYTKAYNAVGETLKRIGMPMLGGYVIRVTDYEEVSRETDREKAVFLQEVDKIAMNREILVRSAREKMQGRFYDTVIPPAEYIRGRSFVKLHICPISTAPAGMPQAEEVNNHIQAQYQEALQAQMGIVKDVIEKTKETITAVLEGDMKYFKQGNWDAIAREVKKLKGLNLDNPTIDRVADTIIQLNDICKGYKSGDVKTSPTSAAVVTNAVGGMVDFLSTL